MLYIKDYDNIMIITEKYFKNNYNKNLLNENDNLINEFKSINISEFINIIYNINNYFSELISIYLDTQKNKQVIFDKNNNII